MIFIEGPDKVGKTTLADALCNQLGGNYHHFIRPEPGEVNITKMMSACQDFPYNTVFDRFALSCLAYDFKDATDETRVLTEWKDVWQCLSVAEMHRLKSKRNLLIIVRCNEDTLKERFRAEGDANNYVTERELVLMAHLYDMMRDLIYLLPNHKPDLWTLNTSEMSVDQFMNNFDARMQNYLK